VSRSDLIYKASIVLMVLQVLYGFAWAAHDLAIRFGLWPGAGLEADYIASLTVLQETFFFAHVALNPIALVLLLRRNWLVLPVFAVSFVLDRLDWILMAGNTVLPQLVNLTVTTPLSLMGQGILLALLVVIAFDGTLGRRA
jgi:hypothetical protein